jgi:hypothetical protein
MKIVRGRLAADAVSPKNQRVNLDTNVFQISPDNGTTWVNAPESDPRTNPAYILPLPTPYEGIQCDVAARMVAQLQDTLTIFISAGDVAQFATEVMAVFSATVPVIGWFVGLILLIGNTLVDIGQSNIEDAFTSDVYEAARCIFECRIEADGTITLANLNRCYDDIEAAYPGTVAGTIAELRFFYGDVSMINAGVVRDETGDCSGCDACSWCYEWADPAALAADMWSHVYNTGITDIWAADMMVELTRIEFAWHSDGIGTGGDSALAWWAGASLSNRIDLISPISGQTSPYIWTGDQSCTGVGFGGNAASGSGGHFTVDSLHLEGVGTHPDWSHGTDCS